MSASANDTQSTMTQEEQERIASCYTKTSEYYGELPESCSKCADFDVCLTLDTNFNDTEEKGGN